MGWDSKRNGQRYFYRSERRPGGAGPVKVYLGRGPEAEEAARQVEERRQERQAARAVFLEEQVRFAVADHQLKELGEFVTGVVRAALRGAGYHNHKGEWRRRRHGRDANHSAGR